MHPSVWAYVNEMRPDPTGLTVLEVGSYADAPAGTVGDGTVRSLFDGCTRYVGVDIRPGPNVDQVLHPLSPYPFNTNTFGLVVSTEMLEHDISPWWSLWEMRRVLHHGGLLIVTARGFDERGCYPLHGHVDRWRFSLDGLAGLVEAMGMTVKDARSDPAEPGVFLTAVKP